MELTPSANGKWQMANGQATTTAPKKVCMRRAVRHSRRNEQRAFALELLLVAGHVSRGSFRDAMKIARGVILFRKEKR